MSSYDNWLATDDRLPGESAVGHMVRSMLAAIILGFDEAGMPLTDEQREFLAQTALSVASAEVAA